MNKFINRILLSQKENLSIIFKKRMYGFNSYILMRFKARLEILENHNFNVLNPEK